MSDSAAGTQLAPPATDGAVGAIEPIAEDTVGEATGEATTEKSDDELDQVPRYQDQTTGSAQGAMHTEKREGALHVGLQWVADRFPKRFQQFEDDDGLPAASRGDVEAPPSRQISKAGDATDDDVDKSPRATLERAKMSARRLVRATRGFGGGHPVTLGWATVLLVMSFFGTGQDASCPSTVGATVGEFVLALNTFWEMIAFLSTCEGKNGKPTLGQWTLEPKKRMRVFTTMSVVRLLAIMTGITLGLLDPTGCIPRAVVGWLLGALAVPVVYAIYRQQKVLHSMVEAQPSSILAQEANRALGASQEQRNIDGMQEVTADEIEPYLSSSDDEPDSDGSKGQARNRQS
jgi:hypothetical protein